MKMQISKWMVPPVLVPIFLAALAVLYGWLRPWDQDRFRTIESNEVQEAHMVTGTVKWFNAIKGFGFIQPEDGSADVYVHISAVEKAGLRTLKEGQQVRYERVQGQNGKHSAQDLSAST